MLISYLGTIICFLSLAGMAEAITGNGSYDAAVVWFVIGFILSLTGLIKKRG
jgi:hypothetical protein